jgi:hypothetical protein
MEAAQDPAEQAAEPEESTMSDRAVADEAAKQAIDEYSERPEVFVGAAFLGGFALAKILKRFGR